MHGEPKIEEFLEQRRFALAGLSRGGGKWGNRVMRDLTDKGYEILPVHPAADAIDGVRCFSSLADLPEKVDGLILVVPPKATENLVREAAELGIPRIWMQPGAESPEAVRLCRKHGIDVVFGECIMVRSRRPPNPVK